MCEKSVKSVKRRKEGDSPTCCEDEGVCECGRDGVKIISVCVPKQYCVYTVRET